LFKHQYESINKNYLLKIPIESNLESSENIERGVQEEREEWGLKMTFQVTKQFFLNLSS
jgi:hypothetical protein